MIVYNSISVFFERDSARDQFHFGGKNQFAFVFRIDKSHTPSKMSLPSSSGAKKPIKRKRLTIKEKFNLIQDHEKHFSVEALTDKYGCARSFVYGLLKEKKKITDDYLLTKNTESKSTVRVPKYSQIDEKTYEWLRQALDKKLPVSGTLVQAKAKEIGASLNELDFKASNGWLEKFKSRHNLTFSALCGESNEVDKSSVEEFRNKLPEIIAGYHPEDIANCDETGLYFRAIPNKTLHIKGEKCYGGKHSKERLTLLLCCFGDGTFEKPLVIGKAENPRCFKSIKKENLPVTWKSNKKAWMTTTIMEEWLIRLNRKMFNQKRKILLFLDNATSHPNLKLSNVELVFLPPGTTSYTQPLDQGIIGAFKIHYRSQILKRLICNMDKVSNVSDLVSSINCLDAIYWIKEALRMLPSTVVPNCFRHAGFILEQSTHSVQNNDFQLRELRVLLTRIPNIDCTAEEYASIDSSVLTEHEKEFNTVEANIQGTNEESDDEDGIDDQNVDSNKPIDHFDALQYLQQIKTYATEMGSDSLFEKTDDIVRLIQDLFISKQNKQTSIDDYFKKQ